MDNPDILIELFLYLNLPTRMGVTENREAMRSLLLSERLPKYGS